MTSPADRLHPSRPGGEATSLTALLEITKQISLSIPSEALPSAIADAAARLLEVEWAVFRLREDDQLVLTGVSGAAPADLVLERVPLEGSLSGRVILEDRPVLAELHTMSPPLADSVTHARARGFTQFLGIPLRVAGRTIGVLGILGRRPFADRDRELGEAFAEHAAIAVEHAKLWQATTRQAERMQALSDLTRLLSATLDPEVVGRRAVDSVCKLLAATSAVLYRLEPEGERLSEVARSDQGPSFAWTSLLEPGIGIAGLAIARRAPVASPDVMADSRLVYTPEMRARVSPLPQRALMAAPLRIKGRILGVLAVAGDAGRMYSDEEMRLAQSFADQAALALENARLYDNAERGRREAEMVAELTRDYAGRLRALEEVNRLVSSSLQVNEVLENLAAAVARFFEAPIVLVWRLDMAAGRIDRAVTHGDPELDAELPRQFAVGEGAVGWVILHRQPILWCDMGRDARVRGADALRRRGYSYLSVYPIALGDRVLGAFAFCRAQPAAVTAETESLLGSLAAQAAVALDNARLHTETAHLLDDSRALLEVVRILNSTLDARRLLREVTIKVAQVCGVDRCSVSRWDGEVMVPLAAQFADGHKRPDLWQAFTGISRSPLVDVPVYRRAVEERRTVVIDDTSHSDALPRDWVDGFDVRSYLVTPLIRQDQVIGIMTLIVGGRPRPFQRRQVDLAEAIAGQLALAVANTGLFQEARERLRETEVLLAVGSILSAGVTAPELMRRVAREVARALEADTVGLCEMDPDGGLLTPIAGYHVPPSLLEIFASRRLALGHDPGLYEAWQSGRAVWWSDTGHDARLQALTGLPPSALLVAPITIRGKTMGVIVATWWRPGREFQPSEIRLIEGVAGQVGLAMDNAELARATRRQVEELTVLHELARVLTGQLDRAAVLEVILSHVPRVFAVPSMVVLLPFEDGDDLEVVARWPHAPERATPPAACPAGPAGGLKRVVFEEGRAIRTSDYVGECARRRVQPVETVRHLAHWMGVPLRAGNAVLGVIGIGSADRPFSEADERLLTNIADLAALALRSVRLFTERTRAYGELTAAQEQLVRTEKLRALGEMASGVAHDFNNLLSAILGRAQLLQGEVGDPRHRQWLEVIERSALDGSRTVRRLQEFTRIRRDHPFVAVDLSRIARETLEITQSRWRDDVRRRGVTVDIRTTLRPVPEVAGDPAELREALTNIILNAVDAMPEGGLLTVTTASTDSEVRLTVTDTGVGMPAEVRRRIFDPFFTTKGPQGTGLGLSMTYGIITRHGARIEVESEEGQGATFRLIFPRPLTVGLPPAAPGPPLRAPVSLSCLVVDDEIPVGTLLGDVLESGGHRAVVCADGADAVARFRAERFDVVFTDLAMPGLSGWQVAGAIKAMAPEVPVFIVTGFGVELSPEECRAHGVDAVLAKPLSVQEILNTVARVAEATRERRTLSEGRQS